MVTKALLFALASLTVLGTVPMPGVASPGVTVFIRNFAFEPATVTVAWPVGAAQTEPITWTSEDFLINHHNAHNDPHGLEPVQGLCLETPQLPGGTSFTTSISAECVLANGFTLTYHCHIHPGMRGTLQIQPVN